MTCARSQSQPSTKHGSCHQGIYTLMKRKRKTFRPSQCHRFHLRTEVAQGIVGAQRKYPKPDWMYQRGLPGGGDALTRSLAKVIVSDCVSFLTIKPCQASLHFSLPVTPASGLLKDWCPYPADQHESKLQPRSCHSHIRLLEMDKRLGSELSCTLDLSLMQPWKVQILRYTM